MTIRMILDAPAVSKLIEGEQDAFLEVTEKASKQVALEMAKRLTEKWVKGQVDNFLRQSLFKDEGYFPPRLKDEWVSLIDATIRERVTLFLDRLTKDSLDESMAAAVAKSMNQHGPQIQTWMNGHADRILMRRFYKLFADRDIRLDPPPETAAPEQRPQ